MRLPHSSFRCYRLRIKDEHQGCFPGGLNLGRKRQVLGAVCLLLEANAGRLRQSN